MKNWKKTIFALALVAGLCGGAFAEDRNHDKGKAPVTQRWDNRDHDQDRNHDRDDRYRVPDRDDRYRTPVWGYNPGPDYRYGSNYGYYPNTVWGYSGYGSGSDYQAGFNTGLIDGRFDRDRNRAYQPGNYKAFKNGDQAYRNGFLAGYNSGFTRG